MDPRSPADLGYGVRPPVVFYNRANEAGAMLKPGDFDWESIFGEGVRWFHSGGIYAALSTTTSELIIEAMRAAKQYGAVTSFDLNYRGKLWESIGGLEAAQETFKRIVEHVDVLVGNEEDLQMGLGVKGPDVEKKSKLDTSVFFEMIASVNRDFPNVKMVATTLREVENANRHQWGAVIWYDGQRAVSPTCELGVIDRIGGGVSHAVGTGGRDLSETVGGLTTLMGIEALAQDAATEVLCAEPFTPCVTHSRGEVVLFVVQGEVVSILGEIKQTARLADVAESFLRCGASPVRGS